MITLLILTNISTLALVKSPESNKVIPPACMLAVALLPCRTTLPVELCSFFTKYSTDQKKVEKGSEINAHFIRGDDMAKSYLIGRLSVGLLHDSMKSMTLNVNIVHRDFH